MLLSMFKIINRELIGNGTCPGPGLMCSLLASFDSDGVDDGNHFQGNFRVYRLR